MDIPENTKILVVDDDPEIQTLFRDFLSDDCEVMTADDGETAWELLRTSKRTPEVVLCDLEMPNGDGLSLLSWIKSSYPGICVIMISGSVDVQKAVQAMRDGAFDYITKPIRVLEEVKLLIQRWFHQQSLEAKLAQYARLHREMKHNMKTRTFLCLDVCHSLELKESEDPFLAQYSFSAYHRFIERKVEMNAGRIHSTAGDGVMACFDSVEGCLNAARSLLHDLERFNATQNRLSLPFVLRVGIHTGSVVIDDAGEVNSMFAKTLDIAGHIQKHADPSQIELSEVSAKSLSDRSGLIQLGRVVDGLQIYSLAS